MSRKPIALEAFECLAEAYAARIDTKAHNAFYDRPAVTSLLPSVDGRSVLDAGCGPGAYAEWLVQNGADVVAFDVSPAMVRLASRRLQGRGLIVQADLSQPLNFLLPESFDVVVSALALDFVRDWTDVFRQFFRVLKDPGHLIFSVAHPSDEFFEHHPHGNYFDIEAVSMPWNGFGVRVDVPYFRRPLGAMIDPLLHAGFVLERVLEPRPLPQFKAKDPSDYEKLMRQPGFICFRARKGQQQLV